MTPTTAAPHPEPRPAAGSISSLSRAWDWLFSQRHFHVKLLSGTAAGVVVITVLAAIFLLITYRNYQQDALRSHTTEVLRIAGALENDLAELETTHRGYLLGGEAVNSEAFVHRQSAVKARIETLTDLILENPTQRKRVMRLQELVNDWLQRVAAPTMKQRESRATSGSSTLRPAIPLGESVLDQAREVLNALRNEEQMIQNQRMRDQEWSVQSTQILDLVPKLEHSVVDMEKEKRGYLLTGDASYVENYKAALTAFANYRGYLSILVAQNPEQSALLDDVKTGVDQWILVSGNPEMEARRLGRDLSNLGDLSKSEKLIAAIQQRIALFQQKELHSYETRATSAKRRRILTTGGLGALCILAVALLIISNSYSFVLVRRQLSKLDGVESRIKSIIHNILDGMITVDDKGTICSMNPAAEKMFGCVNNEMIGHKFTRLVPKCYTADPEAPPAPCSWGDFARRTGSAGLAVGKNRRQATFPIEISLSEMVVDGHLLYVAMVRDVTERKRFETEIASEKESLAVTLRSIGDGVITTDV
ncbi:MAG: CHASE3 domain-containing protein, partial [Chthoniobacterales bacterium]